MSKPVSSQNPTTWTIETKISTSVAAAATALLITGIVLAILKYGTPSTVLMATGGSIAFLAAIFTFLACRRAQQNLALKEAYGHVPKSIPVTSLVSAISRKPEDLKPIDRPF